MARTAKRAAGSGAGARGAAEQGGRRGSTAGTRANGEHNGRNEAMNCGVAAASSADDATVPATDDVVVRSIDRAEELVGEYISALRVERNASEQTMRAYATDLRAFLSWCRRTRTDPLTADHRQLRAFLAELDQARYARTTVNRHLSSLKGFYRWMAIAGIAENDAASVLSGPRQGRHLPHVLRPEEMVRLLSVHASRDAAGNARKQSATDLRDQALLEFLYACGARISEASNLDLGDVDFDERQVRLFGKGRKERIVPLHDLCVSSLRRYLIEGRPDLMRDRTSPAFFVSTRGNRMGTDAMRKMFKQTVRAAGLSDDLSPHDMRHTFATDLLNGGADLRSVQEMLGHSSLSTTQIYTHLTPERLKQVHHQALPRG